MRISLVLAEISFKVEMMGLTTFRGIIVDFREASIGLLLSSCPNHFIIESCHLCLLSIDTSSIAIALPFVELHFILSFLVIVEITIPLTQKHAYNGQFSKKYQKISLGDRRHISLYFHATYLRRTCGHPGTSCFLSCSDPVSRLFAPCGGGSIQGSREGP